MRKIFLWVMLCCIYHYTEAANSDFLYNRQLMMGSIAFPTSISPVPLLRIYYAGDIIQSVPSRADSHMLFQLFTPADQTRFYLLITESESLSVHTIGATDQATNTIDYLRLRPDSYYLLYVIDYEANSRTWTWQQAELVSDQVPLDAIIMVFNPHYVEGLAYGSAFQLPTIKIKKSLLVDFGNDQKCFEQYINRLLIGCLDCDTFHRTRIKTFTKACQNNTHILQISMTT